MKLPVQGPDSCRSIDYPIKATFSYLVGNATWTMNLSCRGIEQSKRERKKALSQVSLSLGIEKASLIFDLQMTQHGRAKPEKHYFKEALNGFLSDSGLHIDL